jgi:GNAT superfamily N-acetyltransferase
MMTRTRLGAEPPIRLAAPEDAGPLSLLARRAKGHWGYPEEWLAAWEPELTRSPADIRRMHVHVARSDDHIAGFYALDGEGRTLTLEHFWVDPDHMGRGVGRTLFRHALDYAAGHGAGKLQIESDPNAESFYVHMGARRVGWRSRPVAGTDRRLPLLVIELTRSP